MQKGALKTHQDLGLNLEVGHFWWADQNQAGRWCINDHVCYVWEWLEFQIW